MNLFSLYAELGLKDDGYRQGIKDATAHGKSFASGLVSSVNAGTIALGNLMADAAKKAGNAIMDFGKKGLDYNRTMEDYTINFKTLLGGSSEAASQMVGALEEMAAKTPFAMEHLAGSTQTLLSFGIESDKVMDIMSMLGDVSMGNSQKFESLSRAFGQISAAGKLTGEDLNQLIDQGFNPLQTISEITGASMSDLKAVMSGQKTSKDFNKMMKDAQKEVKKFGDNASEGAKMLVQMGKDGAISADLVTQVFQKVTEEGGLYYNAMENASQSTSGMISTLSDNWTALLGSVFTPASQYLQGTLLPAAIGAVDTLQNAYNEGGLSGMLEAVGQLAVDLGTKLVDALADAKTKITEALPGIVEAVTTWVSEKKEEVGTQATSLFNSFVDALPGVIESVSAALPGIVTAVAAWVVEGKLSMGEQAVSLFNTFADAIPTVVTSITESLPGIVKAVTDFVVAQAPVLLTEALTLFGGLTDGLSTAITNITESLPGIIESLVTSTTENLPKLLELGGQMVGEIIAGIVGAVPQILAAGLGFVTTLVTEIGKYDWLTIGSNIISGLVSGLQTAATTSLASIKQVFTDIWSGIKEVLGIHSPSTLAKEAGGFIVEGFANGVEAGKETFGEKITNVFTSIWDGIKNIFGFGGGKENTVDAEGEAQSVGMSVVEGLASGLSGEDEENSAVTGATSLGEKVIEALNTALDVVDGISNVAATIGSAVSMGIDQGAQDQEITGMDVVATNVFNALVTAMSIVGGISGYFKPVGHAIANGIAAGIKEKIPAIVAAAISAAKAAESAARSALKIKSPSRVMMEIGRNYAEGFALGISQNTGLVANAARGTAQAAMYGSYMGDMNITQNINAIPMSPNELAMQTANALQMLRFA